MYREFGLDHFFMHQPSQVAQSAYAAAIAEAVTQFEPRAQVTNVTFDDNAKPGQMCPLVEVVFLADGE